MWRGAFGEASDVHFLALTGSKVATWIKPNFLHVVIAKIQTTA